MAVIGFCLDSILCGSALCMVNASTSFKQTLVAKCILEVLLILHFKFSSGEPFNIETAQQKSFQRSIKSLSLLLNNVSFPFVFVKYYYENKKKKTREAFLKKSKKYNFLIKRSWLFY